MQLTTLQHRLLIRLALGAYTTGDLAKHVFETPSSVSHQLLPLRNAGWVFSTRGVQDQHVTWQLSEFGISQLHAIRPLASITVPPVDKPKTYILWCPTSKKAPTVTYPNLPKAQEVQRIMAERCPGQVFHICEVQAGLKLEVVSKYQEVTL